MSTQDTNTDIANTGSKAGIVQAGGSPNESRAMVPTTYAELERFADTVSQSRMVPKEYRGKPGDVMVAVMQGAEVGLKPLQSLQNIAIINGKPSIYGDAAMALVRRSSACEWIREEIQGQGQNRVAICTTKRVGEPEPREARFSVADAKQARLWGRSGPWTTYPQRMLQMRARSWCLRDVYADVLQGLYIAEEAADIPGEDTQETVEVQKQERGTAQGAVQDTPDTPSGDTGTDAWQALDKRLTAACEHFEEAEASAIAEKSAKYQTLERFRSFVEKAEAEAGRRREEAQGREGDGHLEAEEAEIDATTGTEVEETETEAEADASEAEPEDGAPAEGFESDDELPF